MKQRRQTGIWLMLAPLYIFTILFVAGPLIYMVVLSFLQRGEVWGVVNSFTLDNYKNILTPIYLQTFAESFKLAITSTVFITLLGYPFGYFMAKLPPVWEKAHDAFDYDSVLDEFADPPVWLDDHLPRQWHAGSDSDGPGAHQFPPKLLYTYPAVVVGMVYALLQFMILAVYSSAEKMDWSLVEAARDLGASPFRAFCTVTLNADAAGAGCPAPILTFIPSMGLFFIADILGGNKVVLVGSLIQDQLMKAHNQPFAAALSVVLMAHYIYDYAVQTRHPFQRTGGPFMEKPHKAAQRLPWGHSVPYLFAHWAGGRLFLQRKPHLYHVERLFPALV